MAVNKGLLTLVENEPNFSNQALENAVDTLKVGWVIKSSDLDTAIQDNTVLTTSQKNDLKDDIFSCFLLLCVTPAFSSFEILRSVRVHIDQITQILIEHVY